MSVAKDDPMSAPASPAAAPWILGGISVTAACLAALALGDASRAREAAEQARAETQKASASAAAAREAAERAAKETGSLRADLDMLIANVDAIQRNVKEIADRKWETGGAPGNPFYADPMAEMGGPDPPPAQRVLEFTPELRESLRAAVAKKGVELLEDRVVIPGRVILRQGALEYLAVFPGGKQHESILRLEGKAQGEDERVEGLGAALNSCLQALGLRPGTPLRVLPGGRTIPARGSPVHIAIEWEEGGRPVRVRAEDLLWDRERNAAMEPGKFIYVGSSFEEDGYAPDLTGCAVAVYSVWTCVVDLDDPRAANDTVFLPCTPRIPEEGTAVRVVFSPKPLPPTRTWDAEDPQKRTDAPAPPAEGGDRGK
jgi:hypothetical protein